MNNWSKVEKVISRLHCVVTIIPYFSLSAVITLALSLRISLGRWPIAYHDSLNFGSLAVLDEFTMFIVLLLLVSPIVWILSGAFLVRPEKRSVLKRRAIIYGIGIVVFFTLNYFDSTGFFNWFWD